MVDRGVAEARNWGFFLSRMPAFGALHAQRTTLPCSMRSSLIVKGGDAIPECRRFARGPNAEQVLHIQERDQGHRYMHTRVLCLHCMRESETLSEWRI
jgi:hypothetical protein